MLLTETLGAGLTGIAGRELNVELLGAPPATGPTGTAVRGSV